MEIEDFSQTGLTTSYLLESSLSISNTSFISGTTEEPPWIFDDIYQRIVVAALLFVIAVIGLTGNILTIVAVILSKKLHTIANVFVVNLTIAGGLSCATLPFTIANMIANTGTGVIPPGLCTFVSLMSYFSFSGTIVSHALIAFDRYYRITKPHYKYHKMFTKCRITIFIIIAWVYANTSVFLAIFTNVNIMYSMKYRVCLPDIVDPDIARVSIFRATTIDLFILVLVLICYTAIIIYIYRHNKKLLGMFNASTIRNSLTKRFGSKSPSGKDKESGSAPQAKSSRYDAPIILISVGPLREAGNDNPSSDFENENSENNVRNDELSDVSFERTSSSQSSSYGIRYTGRYDSVRTEQSKSLDTLSPSPSNSPRANGVKRTLKRQSNVKELPPDDVSSVSGTAEEDSSTGNETNGKSGRERKRRKNHKISSLSQEGMNLRTTLNARQVKITMNMFLVVAVYVICIAPYVVCLIVDSFERIFPYVAVFYALSNAINPAIYAWKHPYFRAVFKPMIQLKFSKIPNPSPVLKIFTQHASRRSKARV